MIRLPVITRNTAALAIESSAGTPLLPKRLGPYELSSRIGAGGMGEVYRATDTKLKRDVAVKVLPETLASHAERLGRLRREAQLLASLNHPNIAQIYGIEEGDGFTALVMELVEGATLADRIAQGPIPADEAVSIARQVALAMEAAHEQSIIHRDLKPANVKVRSDGTVKVLDFGLAKALEPSQPSSPGVSTSPTITTPLMTEAGLVLGTAAYMSPEQARGKLVDRRTDVWAFGCVLYEMVTGRPAFPGETVSDTLAAILTREPDWRALPPAPARLHWLLHRCLVKDPSHRLHDIADARIELDEMMLRPVDAGQDSIAGRPASPARSARRERTAWMAAGALLVALIAEVTFHRSGVFNRPDAVEAPTYRSSILFFQRASIFPPFRPLALRCRRMAGCSRLSEPIAVE